MRAVFLPEQGDIDNLVYDENFPDPEVGAGEVIIEVKATSLNYHDVFTCHGMPGIKIPLPIVIGLDTAGEVAGMGPGVEGWSVGDRVLVNPLNLGKGLLGEMVNGGTAELCKTDAGQLIRIPDGVSFADAASLPIAYGTAHRMMVTRGNIAKEDRVLILGASGGVGSCCVLLAKMVGAEVVACGSTPEKLQVLKDLGADHVIDYTKDDFVKKIWELYDKPYRRAYTGGVDMVVNFTGGDTWVKSLRCLKRGGRLMTCGATAGYGPETDLRFIWTFELDVRGSNSWTVDDLEKLLAYIDGGEMKPLISETLPLQNTVTGVHMLADRQVIGKIIVTP
jgi:alcohol dehydrogenase